MNSDDDGSQKDPAQGNGQVQNTKPEDLLHQLIRQSRMNAAAQYMTPLASSRQHQHPNLLALHHMHHHHHEVTQRHLRQPLPHQHVLTDLRDSLNLAFALNPTLGIHQLLAAPPHGTSVDESLVASSTTRQTEALLLRQLVPNSLHPRDAPRRFPLPVQQSCDASANLHSLGTSLTPDGNGGKVNKRDPVHAFPTRLHEILATPEYNEFIAWLPHGRAWKILNKNQFEKKVIPHHFRHARYASFMRQVNGWGFKRLTEGPDHNAYYHEHFLRDYPQLCWKMQRPTDLTKPISKKAKGTKQPNIDSDDNK